MMEEQQIAARSHLRQLHQQYPYWSHRQMALETGYSIDWVRKWRKRFRQVSPEDDSVIYGHSRRHQNYRKIDARVAKRIVELRQELIPQLRRTPGPVAILHYLHQEEELKNLGVHIPTSSSTIWQILAEAGVYHRPPPPEHRPFERPKPMQGWAMDFKDISTIPPQEGEKQQHQVEILNLVDEGTSFWINYRVRTDFSSETVLMALSEMFLMPGIPKTLRMDRDPRFVGPSGMGDFPSSVQRFLSVLGITSLICPPQQPQKNPFVERLHGNLNREWLQWERPRQLNTATNSLEKYYHHYTHERPHQGSMTKNRTFAEAFPQLPLLPRLPQQVDPDRWLHLVTGRQFTRRVRANGSITLDNIPYYIQKSKAKETVLVQIDPTALEVIISQQRQVIKRMPIKGLIQAPMSFDDYLKLIRTEARREDQVRIKKERGKLRQRRLFY